MTMGVPVLEVILEHFLQFLCQKFRAVVANLTLKLLTHLEALKQRTFPGKILL